MITVFGSINIDLVTRVPVLPAPGETVLASTYQTVFGGKGANQAVAAARALGHPSRVRMIGAVGDDGFGRGARDNLVREGIDISGVATVSEPTGCAFIQVDDRGENVITVASGANRLVRADMLASGTLDEAHVVVLQMELDAVATAQAAQCAKAAHARVILNFAPVPSSLPPDVLRTLLANTDVLVVNEHEAKSIVGILGGVGMAESQDIAAFIARGSDVTAIVTLGANGALAVGPDRHLLRVDSPAVTAIDTTGAGDTFVGVLAAGMLESLDLSAAMTRACTAAALACTALGAQSAMPRRSEII